MNERVFVYGTLRGGEQRGHVLNGCERIGEFHEISGTLHNTGAFPAMILNDTNTVVGEVYNIRSENLWNQLDAIEGVPFLYVRAEVEVPNVGRCITYVPSADFEQRVIEQPIIQSGDWINGR